MIFAVCLVCIGCLPRAQAAQPIAIPVESEPASAIDRAEQLLDLARQGKLDDRTAETCASLLQDDDPFVAGIAEWAIAEKVNEENNGEVQIWPKANSPNWYRAWMTLDDRFLLKCDYVRQGAVWDVHHSPGSIIASLSLIKQRADGSAVDARRQGIDADGARHIDAWLSELDGFRDRAVAIDGATQKGLRELRKIWIEARLTARRIVLANPAADIDQLVFTTRHPALFANITGSQYPWSHKPGGDICIRQGLAAGADCRSVLQGRLGKGHVHGFDLAWDAKRIVFGWASQANWPPPWDTISGDNVFRLRGHETPTHLYELELDGESLRQLTDHPYWSDFEPTYTAGDDVVFASDRSGRSSECGKFTADHTVINLFRWQRNTGEVRRLNDNKDIDRYPHSLDNGQIAYTRWDYQERHFLETHAVWSVRPDGSMADAVFNQHLKAPYGFRDVRSVPGGNKLVAVATGHHTLAYGPIVVIDSTKGVNNPAAIRIITPRVSPQEGPMAGAPVASGGPPDRGGVYQTPWALSETYFLASYSYSSSKQANGFSLYVVDAYGNRELVHRDRIYSCSFPLPLRARPRPPQLPPVRQAEDSRLAVCYLSDVESGLQNVPKGTVKFLRISQHVGWPLDDQVGAMRYIPGNAWENKFGHWNWAPVRVIGEVPVSDDGSACFYVPVDTGIYFQALDADHLEVRRMRSHVTMQPGEVRGCVGCHETKTATPDTKWNASLAFNQSPRRPEPPEWGADRLLGYEWMIQPIMDKHCVRCHGSTQPAGDLDFTATRHEDGFVQSFRTLFGRSKSGSASGKRLVTIANRLSDSSVSQPRQIGSSQSPLIATLRNDPLHAREVDLSPSEWLRLVTWIDANAPYHDHFFNRRPPGGGEPLRNIPGRLTDPLAGLHMED